MKSKSLLLWVLITIIFIMCFPQATAQQCDSCIDSYDTIYADVRDTSLLYRQIYINDIYNKKEIYILKEYKDDKVIKTYKWETPYTHKSK